jgi:predicted nucleotide-binding protein (sugar kinase/HSP70/actin superfamily)
MTVGIPRALLYHQYGVLWESFLPRLGYEAITSGPTTKDILEEGVKAAHSESCLPAKAYLGHVQSLLGKCDCILVPPVRDGALCMRFWGMGDVVRHTFPGVKLLEMPAGAVFGGSRKHFMAAAAVQAAHDKTLRDLQNTLFAEPGAKILVAARPYVAHDPLIGGPVTGILAELGAVVFHSGRFDAGAAQAQAVPLSPRLGWTAGREAMGAAALCRDVMDGIVLLPAFPCAQDALVNEMIARCVGGVPVIQINLDGLQGEAGLRTRLESFMDIVEGRRNHGPRHYLPAHGQLSHPPRAGNRPFIPGCRNTAAPGVYGGCLGNRQPPQP